MSKFVGFAPCSVSSRNTDDHAEMVSPHPLSLGSPFTTERAANDMTSRADLRHSHTFTVRHQTTRETLTAHHHAGPHFWKERWPTCRVIFMDMLNLLNDSTMSASLSVWDAPWGFGASFHTVSLCSVCFKKSLYGKWFTLLLFSPCAALNWFSDFVRETINRVMRHLGTILEAGCNIFCSVFLFLQAKNKILFKSLTCKVAAKLHRKFLVNLMFDQFNKTFICVLHQ